ncbi:NAD(+) diphosphatase [Novosphingobium bradum]|uniref:NAD(+) diphosphatase n=1 Tax=Novosphingobium bradum TaxID=1737444 RepID=A0ABV7IQY9_9SPHN
MRVKPTDLDIAFAGSPVDRADRLRTDASALEALKGPQARLLLLDGLAPRLDGQGALAWGSLADAEPGAEIVFLGLMDGAACFAQVAPALWQGGAKGPRNMFPLLSALSPGDMATFGGAKALVDWHARHRFCARCGSPTELAKGGWQRNCTSPACKAEHFPRVDPVTIMLVELAGAPEPTVLLGRQPMFPPLNYSALAGFVEPGETIEEAVAREIEEEAGVRARDVSYVVSQPWPFVSSLMIGCHAWADSPEITIDRNELDDARWFTRTEVARAMDGDADAALKLPPRFAIAHQLLRWWLARG